MFGTHSMPRLALTGVPRLAVLVLVATLLAACLPPTIGDPPPGGSPEGWKLTWQQEWNEPSGTRPNTAFWNYAIGNRDTNGWGNNELQYYTSGSANAVTDGQGNLVISARRATATQTLPCWHGGNCAYTSARLHTQNKVTMQYGRIEARMKVPPGVGLWPAFWMMGNTGYWPIGGEIDVMEWVGSEPTSVSASVHGPYPDETVWSRSKSIELSAAVSNDFHVFALEKRPGDLRFFVDGVQFLRVTRADMPAGGQWVMDQPFYVLLNLAVGGNWPGPPNASTVFPAQLKVDYLRIYS